MALKVYERHRELLSAWKRELEYHTVLVDLRSGEQKEPFISLNPFGQVPGFEDGDLKLYESRAITKYIAHAYADKGTPLLPKDPKKLGTVLLWLEVEVQRFDAAGQKLVFEILIKPMKGLTAVEQLQAQLSTVLECTRPD